MFAFGVVVGSHEFVSSCISVFFSNVGCFLKYGHELVADLQAFGCCSTAYVQALPSSGVSQGLLHDLDACKPHERPWEAKRRKQERPDKPPCCGPALIYLQVYIGFMPMSVMTFPPKNPGNCLVRTLRFFLVMISSAHMLSPPSVQNHLHVEWEGVWKTNVW